MDRLDKAMVTRMVSLLLAEDPTQILVLDPETGEHPILSYLINTVPSRPTVSISVSIIPPPHTHTLYYH